MSGARMRRFWIPLAATLMSLVALGPMPYGYYMLLRIFFCAVCFYYLLLASAKLSSGHRVTLGGLAVLYTSPSKLRQAHRLDLGTVNNKAKAAFQLRIQSGRGLPLTSTEGPNPSDPPCEKSTRNVPEMNENCLLPEKVDDALEPTAANGIN